MRGKDLLESIEYIDEQLVEEASRPEKLSTTALFQDETKREESKKESQKQNKKENEHEKRTHIKGKLGWKKWSAMAATLFCLLAIGGSILSLQYRGRSMEKSAPMEAAGAMDGAEETLENAVEENASAEDAENEAQDETMLSGHEGNRDAYTVIASFDAGSTKEDLEAGNSSNTDESAGDETVESIQNETDESTLDETDKTTGNGINGEAETEDLPANQVPEPGQMIYGQSLMDAMDFYANDKVLYQVRVVVYKSVDNEDKTQACENLNDTQKGREALQQEFERLHTQGYDVELDENGITGYFTRGELMQFILHAAYGYYVDFTKA